MASLPLRIQLLGGFLIVDQGQSVSGVRWRSQQLLATLAIHRQTPQLRRRLAGQLWPETTDQQARTNLRKELYHLRKTLPAIDQLVVSTAQSLHWQPQIACVLDIEVFETALIQAKEGDRSDEVKACELESALQLYSGELWPDCDDDWIEPERIRLHQIYTGALAQLTQSMQSLGHISQGLAWGQRWLHAMPLDEGAYQTMMALYEAKGDRATALQLYHQCMSTLQTELGVNPSSTTTAIYQRLLMADEPDNETVAKVPMQSPDLVPRETHPHAEPTPTPERLLPSMVNAPFGSSVIPTITANRQTLVGRDDIMQTLAHWLGSAENANPALLMLTGEPGIGKTRLLEALSDYARQQRWQCCWGRAYAAEQLRSYGVWIDLLRAASLTSQDPGTHPTASERPQPTQVWSEILGILLGNSDGSDTEMRDRSQLLDAVVQGFQTVTDAEQPLLLLFDDIHWLDEASTALLHYVFRLLGKGMVRIVCAARPHELQENAAVMSLVQSLRRGRRLQEIAVPPLSCQDISTLLQTLPLDDEPIVDSAQIYEDSGGNPLFAMEVARARTHTTEDLSGIIAERLQRLDEASQSLLPWIAALGHRFNPNLLAIAASYPPMQLFTVMEQLEQHQIIRPVASPEIDSMDTDRYEFVHDVIRQAAYNRLSGPRRRLVHRQLATVLHEQDQDDLASEVAYHASCAGNHALAAQSCATAAARSLRLFAYPDVLQLVEQGVRHCQSLPSRDRLLYSAKLLLIRVCAGISPSDVAPLEDQLQQVLTGIPGLDIPDAEVMIRQALSMLHYDQGNLAHVHENSLKALETMPSSPRLQMEVLAGHGACLAEIERDMDRAEAMLLDAQSLAAHLDVAIADIPSGLGCIERYQGRYDQARSYFQQAIQLTKNQGDIQRQAYNLTHLIMVGWDAHQPVIADAESLLQLSPHLPPGSDAAFAQSLITLESYAQGSAKAQAVVEALSDLERTDAQRKVAFVASHACEVALSNGDGLLALTFSTMAHRAAKIVNHPNDQAIATACCVLSVVALNQTDAAEQYAQELQTLVEQSPMRYSARGQTLLGKSKQAMNNMQVSMMPGVSS